MNILYNKRPLIVNPELASLIGLNEAIIIQQIHYWLENCKKNGSNYHDGHYWVYNTYNQWHEQFPFWNVDTIRRAIKKLEKSGLLITGNYNKLALDKTKWYTINYSKIDELSQTLNNDSSRCGHISHMDCENTPYPCGDISQSNTIEYTENTTETPYKVYGDKSQNNTDNHSSNFQEKNILYNDSNFNIAIVRKEVRTACLNYGVTNKDSIDDAVCVVEYYLESFKRVFGVNHPFISQNAMNGVIERFFSGTDIVDCDPGTYFELIDRHFATNYKDCDYNICHFMTDGIRQNRYYESM